MDANVLFNCCTNGVAPDWSRFKSLETGGCITDTMPNGDTYTVGLVEDDRAEFWTVYARDHEGYAEAITDCESRAAVDRTAAELSRISGLPVL